MASSLQTAVMGMRAYQEMLNVTGNNIANADTVAYKEDRITFSDMFSRTLSSGISASEETGGTNPIQVGLGVSVSSVDKNLSQGSFTSTEKDFDLAIDGTGYFVLSDGVGNLFTRDGSFDVDAEGYLVDPSTGYRVQRIGTTGEDDGFQTPGNLAIKIPYDTELPGSRTQTIDFKGNLSAQDYDPTTTRLEAAGLTYTLATGGLADASTEFGDISQLQDFVDGDTIDLTGKLRDGTAVSGTFTYGAGNDGTSVQDLLDSITAMFGGVGVCEASMRDGKLVVADAQEGYSLMDFGMSSSAHEDAMPLDFDYTEAGGAASWTTNINIFDSQARSHSLTATFVRHGQYDNTWDLVLNSCTDTEQIHDRRIAGITFDENGVYQGLSGIDAFGNSYTDPGFEDLDADFGITFRGLTMVHDIQGHFGQVGYYDGLTQNGGDSSACAIDQDGYGPGSLQGVSIGAKGVIQGMFSNGETLDIAGLQIAVFDNPQGLERMGLNYFQYTPAAGATVYSSGAQGRAGMVRQNALEDSNVDIAQEFTQVITAQTGYQMNSRVVRVVNSMLQQLANIIM